MNIIVTGANGFIGSSLIKRLIKENNQVLGIDIVDVPNRIDLSKGNISYIASPIDRLDNFKNQLISFKPNIVYHFAWKGSAGPLREDYSCQVNNAIETAVFLSLCAKIKCRKFIAAGSIAEFEAMDAMYKDGITPPRSYYYGVGKQLAHELCKPLANELNIDLIWAYITNAYGIGENSPRLVNNVLRKILKNEDFQFTSGIQNYDFLYIDDVVEAFYLLGTKGIKNKNYVIGSGNAKPLKEFIKEIYIATNANSKPIFGDVPFNGTNLSLNIFGTKNLCDDTGFRPKNSFAVGIKKTFDWLKNN